jgi:signal transduction histidine kinase
MTNETALQSARALLGELLQAARTGAIIPVRLPGQLEAIETLLAKAEEDEAKAAAQGTAATPEQSEFLKDQAFFISHAVHELRTPMTSIRGYSDMLGNAAMGELNDMQKQFVDTVRTNARRMEGLLTDVSDVSKLKGGTLRMNNKMDMFKNIAMMVENKTRPTAESMNKTLTFEIPSGLPILDVDGEMVAKAMIKLVENALRYTPEEGGQVTVRAAADGNNLLIFVEDNGLGMTPEDMAQLGTIYFRSEREEVRAHKGSGLGIPIAYGIIRLLGGTVDVESAVDEGTRFTVTLPGMG